MENTLSKIYKSGPELIFQFTDNKTVKYNFATKQTTGKNGHKVKNLNTQLRNTRLSELENLFEDKRYFKFLNYVEYNNPRLRNIGSLLDAVPSYSKYEQIFSSGAICSKSNSIEFEFKDIPKKLLKISREEKITLEDKLISNYKANPDALNAALNEEFISLTTKDIIDCFNVSPWSWRKTESKSYMSTLVSQYGYTFKALWEYLDYLATYEALIPQDILDEIVDYARMMSEISPKFEKYPRNFLTTHQIASRNHRRLLEKFDEDKFKSRIKPEMEHSVDGYAFIYPKSTQEIKDEAVAQHNCVASYIKEVIQGNCDILFMRSKAYPEDSWITIEVKYNRIVQAKRKYNAPVSNKEQAVIDKWNTWYAKKVANMSTTETA